jgi:DNA-binding SARP family transcriptional activator
MRSGVDVGLNIVHRLRLITIVLGLVISAGPLFAQTYGLQFSGHEVPLNERTELYLTPQKPIQFDKEIDLSFELRFQPSSISYFGYIFRLVLGDKTIDFMHAEMPATPENFQVVFNGEPSKISFLRHIDTMATDWTKFSFKINLEEGYVSCMFKDSVFTDVIEGYDSREGVRVFFGAHEYANFTTTDVFQMNVRDIELRTEKRSYSWPLLQTEGETVVEVNHNRNGYVKNPNWLLTLHTSWKKLAGIEVEGLTQTAFNPKEDLVYIATSESLYTVNLTDNSIRNREFMAPYKILSSNSLLYDTANNRLVSYSIDHNYISEYDHDARRWSVFPVDTNRLTTYWHHNSFLHPDGRIHTFGGYGQFNYKDIIYRSLPGNTGFEKVAYTGEFYPRYLAASGYSHEEDKLYILGGYGSKSGQQTLSPNYYYELLTYSFEDSSFSKLVDFSETVSDFCFANNAIITDNHLYALAFSKYHFDNKITLVHVDLDDPAIGILGTPIDFRFIDVKSDVELYYSIVSDRLIAVTSYLDGDISELEIFSISFPPQKYHERIVKARDSGIAGRWLYTLFLVLIVALVAGLIIWQILAIRKRSQAPDPVMNTELFPASLRYEPKKAEPVKSSIVLFGGFQVIDREGNDITGSFTQLLKTLFLFIMLNSLRHNKGVSSQLISETFWFDKSVESARNNRAVNIVKLKSLLDKVGTATISKDTGYWKFEYDPKTMEIDYDKYLSLVKGDSKLSKDDICQLLKIVDRGQFLVNTDADWLDVYKSEVSNDIIDTLADYIEGSENEPDFVLHLTNCMFTFDMASEEAMILQCRTLFKLGKHSLAKKSYARFIKEYKNLYDEDYNRTFQSIVEAGADKKG